MKLSKITGIGRPLSPKYATNFAVVLLSALAALAFGIHSFITGKEPVNALLDAFNSGLTFFLGWAIAREYDPDHPFAAFLAASASLTSSMFLQRTSLVLLAFLLLMLRFINRTSGSPATLLDQIAGLALAAWLSIRMDWIVGIMAAAAFSLDGLLGDRRQIRFASASFALLIGIGAVIWGQREIGFAGVNIRVLALSGLLIILSLPLIRSYRSVQSKGDSDRVGLDPQRIQAAQIFFVAAAILIGVKNGLRSSGDMLASGSIIAASSVFLLLRAFIPAFPQGKL